jgi:hypothetical protein
VSAFSLAEKCKQIGLFFVDGFHLNIAILMDGNYTSVQGTFVTLVMIAGFNQ